MANIGFVGCGNMGGALIKALLNNSENSVSIFDTNTSLAASFDGAFVKNSIDELKACDYIFVTVKPQVYPAVLGALSDYNKTLITVAPGFTTQKIAEYVKNARIVRTMPNTPALVGEGVFLVACDADKEGEFTDIKELLSCAGEVFLIPEKLMDTGVALSGSSPAMVYMLIDAMASAACEGGFSKAQAIEIAAKTVLGSAKMVLETGVHPSVLCDNVCSPGGTTIVMVNELEEKGFKSAAVSSMKKCADKASKM